MSELNELSRKTLKSYVSKANKDFKKNVKIDDHDTIHTSNPRKYMKRSEMIDAAKDKLQEESMNELTHEILEAMDQEEFDALVEDYEQLDELSKKTLNSYLKKSVGRRTQAAKDQPTSQMVGGVLYDKLANARNGNWNAKARLKGTHLTSFSRANERNKTDGKTLPYKAESVSEQTLELIDAIESGKSTAIETSFNEIMANKLVSAIDNRRQEIASGLFDMQEETIEEGVVPGSVKKDAKGNVLSFKTAPEDKRPDYQKKSFHELAMGVNRAHVKMVAAKKAEAK